MSTNDHTFDPTPASELVNPWDPDDDGRSPLVSAEPSTTPGIDYANRIAAALEAQGYCELCRAYGNVHDLNRHLPGDFDEPDLPDWAQDRADKGLCAVIDGWCVTHARVMDAGHGFYDRPGRPADFNYGD